jgi:SulP family sulfate permease
MAAPNLDRTPPPSFADLFTPKLVSALREGYGFARFRTDAVAGLTVAIVALPLAMAIGVASGATPEKGLVTAIVAGFLISALGGSRVQIGGPTAAFIVVVYATIEQHGVDGLILATFVAGLILIAVGLLRLGSYVKYIPYPVVIGFTAGIAASIFVSQIKDLLGLRVDLPGDFPGKMAAIWSALPTARPDTILLAGLSLAVLIGVKRFAPRVPNMLAAVVAGSFVALALGLDADTVGTRFGGVPSALPAPQLPDVSWTKLREVAPAALTIALLAGIESLLSAVIADGMTGRRHRSNCELVAQGVANCASALFGGISATGAIARTATNIRAGAQTPVAGMLHAAFLLLFVLVAAPALAYVPLATLAAILAVVAWNISELHAIRFILTKADNGDRLVLLTTFGLTVAVDLTVAIEVGIVLAAIIFMHRMAQTVEVGAWGRTFDGDVADDAPRDHPVRDASAAAHDYLVYRIDGPFFFGAAMEVTSALERIGRTPKAYVLDFAAVPFVDSTAAVALQEFVAKAERSGARVILAGVRDGPRRTLTALGLGSPAIAFADDVGEAISSLDPLADPTRRPT